MADLSELLQAAHGGDALTTLAQKFGISPDQASAALAALSPALAQGLQSHAQTPAGFSQILSHLSDPAHHAAYGDAAALDAPEATSAGGDLLGQIFGGSANVGQITQHVGKETGLSPDLLNQLLPVIASLTIGGVAKSLQGGGLGGLLAQLGGASGQAAAPGQAGGLAGAEGTGAAGGLGAIFGQLASALGQNLQNAQAQAGQAGGQVAGQAAQPGAFGGVFGAVVGSLFGPAPGAPQPGSAPAQGGGAGGLDPALTQAAMNALGGLFQSASASPGLQNVLGQILAKR
jgi:hypothetical protein